MATTPTRTTPPRRGRRTLADDELAAWRALLRAHATLTGKLDDELQDSDGLALGDYDVLIHLAAAPNRRLQMCDLAEAVILSRSGLSRRVERLERAGLVERERGTEDARKVDARLTPAGSRCMRQARITHHAGIERRFLDQFDDGELETLAELLGRVADEPADEPNC